MFWAVLMARVVVGLPFLLFGLNYFLKFFNPPTPELPDLAKQFVGALAASGYLHVVKVLEVVGGVLVLSGRLVPLGLVLLTPIAVNILLYEIYLLGTAGPGLPLTVLCFSLVWAYRSHFIAVFALKPKIG
jgi:uncharacterized membrane protein YphA (DoxX/SURF4 family)